MPHSLPKFYACYLLRSLKTGKECVSKYASETYLTRKKKLLCWKHSRSMAASSPAQRTLDAGREENCYKTTMADADACSRLPIVLVCAAIRMGLATSTPLPTSESNRRKERDSQQDTRNAAQKHRVCRYPLCRNDICSSIPVLYGPCSQLTHSTHGHSMSSSLATTPERRGTSLIPTCRLVSRSTRQSLVQSTLSQQTVINFLHSLTFLTSRQDDFVARLLSKQITTTDCAVCHNPTDTVKRVLSGPDTCSRLFRIRCAQHFVRQTTVPPSLILLVLLRDSPQSIQQPLSPHAADHAQAASNIHSGATS